MWEKDLSPGEEAIPWYPGAVNSSVTRCCDTLRHVATRCNMANWQPTSVLRCIAGKYDSLIGDRWTAVSWISWDKFASASPDLCILCAASAEMGCVSGGNLQRVHPLRLRPGCGAFVPVWRIVCLGDSLADRYILLLFFATSAGRRQHHNSAQQHNNHNMPWMLWRKAAFCRCIRETAESADTGMAAELYPHAASWMASGLQES